MAWGKTEPIKDFTIELARAQAQNEIYKEQIDKLEAQVERLQEALVAATAPRAYEQIQRDKLDAIPADPEIIRQNKEREMENRLFRAHLETVEGPTFKDADDLIASLGRMIGVNPSATSTHSNDES
jgi:multidrug resistance efflux pump